MDPRQRELGVGRTERQGHARRLVARPRSTTSCAQAHAAGIEILMPIADGVPYWASADPIEEPGSWNKAWKPTQLRRLRRLRPHDRGALLGQGRARLRGVERAELLALLAVGPERRPTTPRMLKAAYPAIKARRPVGHGAHGRPQPQRLRLPQRPCTPPGPGPTSTPPRCTRTRTRSTRRCAGTTSDPKHVHRRLLRDRDGPQRDGEQRRRGQEAVADRVRLGDGEQRRQRRERGDAGRLPHEVVHRSSTRIRT